ncbi:hypothetical protein [Limibacillus halophilus]|uniref:Glycosyltransferase RgtA/B/C/D-like domain-containing protein n=1 Tax=Limibacillus halophilus TaxID=1579333 RepID=A0A839SW61_9PROT|nr:hypothetical protein [Limibacillus halophilus]MBB3066279.1 hypothetical protein [Limibacillus halophilus]
MTRLRQNPIAVLVSAEMVSFVTLIFICQLVMQTGIAPGLADPDYQWHLKAGELIAATGALPTGDPFSWTFEGQPWVLHEWLFQLLLYGVYSLGGEPAVLFMTALVGGAALFVAARLADRFIQRPLASCLLTLFFCVILVSFMAPRPHLFSYLFFGVQLGLLWRARYETKQGGLFLLPVLMVVWVNLHGGYFVGLAFLFAFAASESLRLLLVERVAPTGPGGGYLARLWIVLLLTLAASGVNPYGFGHLLYPLTVMQMEAISTISEWATLNFSDLKNLSFVVAFMGFVALMVGRRDKPDLTEILLPLVTVAAGIASARNAPFAVVIMVAYAGRFIGDGALLPLASAFGLDRRSAESQGDSLNPRIERLLNGLIVVLLAGYAIGASNSAQYFSRIAAFRPTELTDFIKQQDLQGRMMNEYGLGGHLIRDLYPERKVFIDGRADLYGDSFVLANHRATKQGENWRRHLDDWQIDYAVVQKQDAIAKLLYEAGDFALVFDGKIYEIYVRRGDKNGAVIQRFETTRTDGTPGNQGVKE